MKGTSEDSPSVEGTSTNVTRLGAEGHQTFPRDSRKSDSWAMGL